MKTILLLFIVHLVNVAALNASGLQEAKKLYSQKKYKQAISMYQKEIDKSKNKVLIYYNIAASYHKLGDYNKAKKYYAKVVNSFGHEDIKQKAYYNIGNLYYNAGQYQAAVKFWKKSLILDSEDEDSRNNLEVGLVKIEKIESAKLRHKSQSNSNVQNEQHYSAESESGYDQAQQETQNEEIEEEQTFADKLKSFFNREKPNPEESEQAQISEESNDSLSGLSSEQKMQDEIKQEGANEVSAESQDKLGADQSSQDGLPENFAEEEETTIQSNNAESKETAMESHEDQPTQGESSPAFNGAEEISDDALAENNIFDRARSKLESMFKNDEQETSRTEENTDENIKKSHALEDEIKSETENMEAVSQEDLSDESVSEPKKGILNKLNELFSKKSTKDNEEIEGAEDIIDPAGDSLQEKTSIDQQQEKQAAQNEMLANSDKSDTKAPDNIDTKALTENMNTDNEQFGETNIAAEVETKKEESAESSPATSKQGFLNKLSSMFPKKDEVNTEELTEEKGLASLPQEKNEQEESTRPEGVEPAGDNVPDPENATKSDENFLPEEKEKSQARKDNFFNSMMPKVSRFFNKKSDEEIEEKEKQEKAKSPESAADQKIELSDEKSGRSDETEKFLNMMDTVEIEAQGKKTFVWPDTKVNRDW